VQGKRNYLMASPSAKKWVEHITKAKALWKPREKEWRPDDYDD
jgi:hypothetical protein